MQLSEFTSGDVLSPVLIAESLRTTRGEIALTLGLGKDAFLQKERIEAVKTQTRLGEMLEILNRVEPQVGSILAAYAWFRSEPLPGFGNRTPDRLVRNGQAALIHAYLDRIEAGGYA